MLFISHRLDEIFTICDTVTVLRDGAVTHDGTTAEHDHGRARPAHGRPRALARCSRSSTRRSARRCSRSRGSRARACSSTSPSTSAAARSSRSPASSARAAARWRARSSASTSPTPGHVTVDGVKLKPGSPSAAMKAGIGLVPEDRRQQGLVMELSIERNIGLTRLQALRAQARRDRRRRRGASWPPDWATKLQLKFHTPLRPRRLPVAAATSRRSCSASGWPPARRS